MELGDEVCKKSNNELPKKACKKVAWSKGGKYANKVARRFTEDSAKNGGSNYAIQCAKTVVTN